MELFITSLYLWCERKCLASLSVASVSEISSSFRALFHGSCGILPLLRFCFLMVLFPNLSGHFECQLEYSVERMCSVVDSVDLSRDFRLCSGCLLRNVLAWVIVPPASSTSLLDRLQLKLFPALIISIRFRFTVWPLIFGPYLERLIFVYLLLRWVLVLILGLGRWVFHGGNCVC